MDIESSVKRLDTNGNGILDPDEQQGYAKFFLPRLQQVDSRIQMGKPIPLNKLIEVIKKAREQRESGRRPRWPRSR